MTEKKTIIKKRPTSNGVVLSILVCFLFALFMRNSKVAAEYIKDGISICMNTLIPSLFPYLVLSDMAIMLSLPRLLGSMMKKPMSFLFGVSGVGACVFVLGILCGFPVGAKSASDLYDRGEISKSECEKLISFCNIPSIGFTVNVVGGLIFGNIKVGWIFWLCTVFCSVISGVINKFIYGNNSCENTQNNSFVCSVNTCKTEKSSAGIFVGAVERSAKSTLLICSYVVFFSCLTGVLQIPLERFGVPHILGSLICGLLELTCGVNGSLSVGNMCLRAVLCGFFVGWSGISVHLQIFSICDGRDLKFSNYIFMKLLQGILCSISIFLIFRLHPQVFTCGKSESLTFVPFENPYHTVCNLIFIFTLITVFLFRSKKEKIHWQSK